jgi:hypothetical protein
MTPDESPVAALRRFLPAAVGDTFAGFTSYGGFLKWGYPNMDGLFHGKSHLSMDDSGVALFFWKAHKKHSEV